MNVFKMNREEARELMGEIAKETTKKVVVGLLVSIVTLGGQAAIGMASNVILKKAQKI